MSIIIAGGGVGGLAAAYYLVKLGYDPKKITLIERNAKCGGQARSAWIDGKHSEYCWHAIGAGYETFWEMLDDIEYKPGVKVAQMTKPMDNFVYCYDDAQVVRSDRELFSEYSVFAFPRNLRRVGLEWSIGDIPALLKIALISRGPNFLLWPFGGREKVIASYDNVRTKEFAANLSSGAKRLLVDSPGIYLGMDVENFSMGSLLRLLSRRQGSTSSVSKVQQTQNAPFWGFAGPTNDIFIDPLVQHLKNAGVTFIHDTIIKIDQDPVKDLNNNGTTLDDVPQFRVVCESGTFRSTYLVNSLPVEQAARTMQPMDEYEDIKRLQQLAIEGWQLQTQVAIETPFRVESATTFPIVTMIDSEWYLMTKCEGTLWDSSYDVQGDILSIGIGLADKKGINGKTFKECSVPEIKRECWAQFMKHGKNLIVLYQGEKMKLSEFFERHPEELPKIEENSNVWYSYYKNGDHLTSWEPKFSNNVGSRSQRPRTVGNVPNMFHATAYTILHPEDSAIFNMETGVTAGKEAAQAVLNIKHH